MSLASRVDTKVVLLGREYAGKTCLIIRFINDTYCGAKEPYRANIDIKVPVFGRMNVGKTCLIARFIYDDFQKHENFEDVKVCLLGRSNVGKTCLLHRFLHSEFLVKTDSDIELKIPLFGKLNAGKTCLNGRFINDKYQNYENVEVKVVLLGKEYGGKTSLVERFVYGTFGGKYQATIGAAFGAKKVEVNGEVVELGIWDTAGSERYEAMSRIYYRGAKAAIICYDLTDRDSWTRTKFWVNELKMNEPECKIYLCGTKKDLVSGENKRNRQVDYHDTTDYAGEIGAEVFETSSKTGENIRELFLKITADYLADPATKREKEKKNLRLQEDTKKGGCCS